MNAKESSTFISVCKGNSEVSIPGSISFMPWIAVDHEHNEDDPGH